MNTNQPHEELIEQYLKDELSASDKQAFENQMQLDAGLSKEVAFQRQVVNGISSYRKAQLKARLDLIEVSPSPISLIGQSSFLKIAGSLILVSTVATGVYLYWNSQPSESIDPIEITRIEETPLPVVPDIPEAPVEPIKESKESKVDTRTQSIEAASPTSVIVEKAKEPKMEKNFSPKVDAPDPDEVTDRALSTELGILPEMGASDVVNKTSKPIDVKTVDKAGAVEITYKYYEGKLFLFGDFNKEPYEILEINSKSNRTIYLYFKEQYFQIEASTEVKPLKPLQNEATIKDLNIIRTSKSE